MNLKKTLFLLFSFFLLSIQAQKNAINLDIELDVNNDFLNIKQEIVYHNNANQALSSIYLHNWPNSYKNNKTPLNKRLLQDFKKDFHFAKPKDLGYTKIKNLTVNSLEVSFENYKADILKIKLDQPLQPKDSIIISANYQVKIPNSKYTRYGKTSKGYHLRYWYLTPAVYNNGSWQTLSNLNLDDLFQEVVDYNIQLKVPENFTLESNLPYTLNTQPNLYSLVEKNRKDVILNISSESKFKTFNTKSIAIKTDLFKSKISDSITKNIFQKEVDFIENILGKYPYKEILVDNNTVNKYSFKEVNGLPSFMKAYPENFKYELKLLQGLTTKFIDDTFIVNKRNDQWLTEGLQTYLMIEYLKKFYPDVNLLGKYSKIWGVRSYKLAEIKQKDKYSIVYQLRTRKLLNQPLTMRADSLSNANKKYTNKFKAGIAIEYLQDYIGDSILQRTLKKFYNTTKLKTSSSIKFDSLLRKSTNKELNWFFDDFINTDKNIDYKIKKVTKTANNDSLKISIKNINKLTVPVSLYTTNDKKIISKNWITNIHNTQTVTIPNSTEVNKVSLNYEQTYPEFNALDNFKKTTNSIIKKPLKLKLYKDFEDPFYTQMFLVPRIKYNLYDGVIFSPNFNNKHFIKHNFQYSISPGYAFESKEVSGSFAFNYDVFHKNSKTIYKTVYGVGGSSFNYDRNLRYTSFSPFSQLFFRRKNLRNLANSSIIAKLSYIDREVDPTLEISEEDKYTILNIKYRYNNQTILNDTRFSFRTELSGNFSKLITEFRHIHFFSRRKSFDIRLYGGVFLNNNTKSNYFSFNATRGSNYLFEHRLIGASEDTGVFSQQYIAVDGGLKSKYTQNTYSNSQIYTANTNIGIWNWLGVYNNIAMLKNKNEKSRFFYENGLRLNLVTDFFEIYLPVYSNEGLEINSSSNYSSKIRFTVSTQLSKIYNFFRRDFL